MTELLADLFHTGRIADIAILLLVLESAALSIYRRTSGGRGLKPSEIAANAAAGICLFLAIRSALTSAPWQQTAVFLGLALLAHLMDLKSRWTRHS